MIKFEIKCTCGEIHPGLLFKDSTHDSIHCRCGLMWTIPKPDKEANVTLSIEDVKPERQYGTGEGEVHVLPGYKVLTITFPS
ncbi:hypothetical protein [Cohnella sp. AR92]|uniref:hypothetical protein n=1 Tax=Cohnella sp. AR92 TaxID=648716 RepID=UPI000F8E8F8E|nr:hypothetical protein [Cohnella sp. AR92]RUS41940.1 hypothetical protein ELR57_27630 [Cohnella sp. AR92]